MHKPSILLTEVAGDWPDTNLAVVQEILQEAEKAMLQRTNKESDPLMDSMNLANLRGYMRWFLVQACLEKAVKAGRLVGITCEWVNLGGVSVLELHGKYTAVTPLHLQHEDDVPRESTFRKFGREQNEISPFLFDHLLNDSEPKNKKSEKIHLLLVHGGKDGEFAYFRAYYDKKYRSNYRLVSANIMKMPMLLPSLDTEPVLEPQVGLKEAAKINQSGA